MTVEAIGGVQNSGGGAAVLAVALLARFAPPSHALSPHHCRRLHGGVDAVEEDTHASVVEVGRVTRQKALLVEAKAAAGLRGAGAVDRAECSVDIESGDIDVGTTQMMHDTRSVYGVTGSYSQQQSGKSEFKEAQQIYKKQPAAEVKGLKYYTMNVTNGGMYVLERCGEEMVQTRRAVRRAYEVTGSWMMRAMRRACEVTGSYGHHRGKSEFTEAQQIYKKQPAAEVKDKGLKYYMVITTTGGTYALERCGIVEGLV